MTTHIEARRLATIAINTVFGGVAARGEIWALAGIACLETNYGQGWKGVGAGSNNMGAIQCGPSWKGERFEYTDTHPNADGTSTAYKIAFRKYPSPLDGWVDLCKVAYLNRGREIVRQCAAEDNWAGVSAALHNTGYYEGFGKTVADRIHNHMLALEGSIFRANKEEAQNDLAKALEPA
jgi:hypothetical protein